MTEEEKKEQRLLVRYTAETLKKQGMSQEMFLEMVDLCSISPEEALDACWALKDRGELEHMASFVWTFRKR